MRLNNISKLTLILLVISITPLVSSVGGVCVTAEATDISPTSIKIGDEFTVGLLIDNCGDEVPDNIHFELQDISPSISVNEPLSINIGKLGYSNSNRFLVYHMKVSEDASPGQYQFKNELTYTSGNSTFTKDGSFYVTVIGDKAEMAIASAKTNPALAVEDELTELTLRIENSGKGSAKSVVVYANHPFKGLKQSFIGTLDPDEDGPAVLTFIAGKAGEYNIPVTISYTDDFGPNEIKTNVNMSILEKPSNTGLIILVLILVALVVAGVYYFNKTKKAKDRIIHQLLTGNGKR